MTISLIEEMVNNYKNKQYQFIIDNTQTPMDFDAKSVHFNLESLKEFIKLIEDEVDKHPEFKLSNLGLRFYYSAYPESDTWNEHDGLSDLTSDYAKLHTLIAIPTAEINGVQFDFDPLDVKTYTGIKPTVASTSIMAENHGPLTPPGSSSGLWF